MINQMPLSPELARLPRIAASFYKAGLLQELVWGIVTGETGRDMVEDAEKLLVQLEKQSKVDLHGLENIPAESGCLIVFNHPNMEILLPAMLELFVGIFENNGKQVRLAMGSEIPMTTKNFNEKTALPGSVWLLERFHGMYSNNIISVPTAEGRKDFLSGRTIAVRKMMRAFKDHNIVAISPEGHVEKNGEVSPVETYHDGSGKMAMMATKMGIPTVPVSVWGSEKEMSVVVGRPFFITAETANLAAVEAMYHVSLNLPEELRGPFR